MPEMYNSTYLLHSSKKDLVLESVSLEVNAPFSFKAALFTSQARWFQVAMTLDKLLAVLSTELVLRAECHQADAAGLG